MYGQAFRHTSYAPPPGNFSPGGIYGPPDLSGGFTPMGVGGRVDPMGARLPPRGGGGGGWLNAITDALGGLTGMEQAYLASSAIGGVANWIERKKDRELRERIYEEGREDEQRRSRRMGESLSRAWGG